MAASRSGLVAECCAYVVARRWTVDEHSEATLRSFSTGASSRLVMEASDEYGVSEDNNSSKRT